MDDSSIQKKIAPVNKRQTQSLSPLSFNSFMTQKKKIQKNQSHQAHSNEENLHDNANMCNNFLDLNKTSLASIFSSHPIAFKLSQELLFFHKPIPFLILISMLNLCLYFYRSFHFTFYSQIAVLLFLYILAKTLIPQIWPIIYETLFLNDDEIQMLKEINCVTKNEVENVDEESNKSSENVSPNSNNNNDDNEESKKKVIPKKEKIDPRYDPKVLNHLRTPEEASNEIFKFINPIRVFLKAFVLLAKDDSKEGLEIMLCIYIFFFCFTNLFDLFWPFVILFNIILIAPGIYLSPQIRRLIIGFRRRWKI